MKKCLLSHLPVLDLPGEIVVLDRAWLSAEQADALQGEQAVAYTKFAAASPQAKEWQDHQCLHAMEVLGLEEVAVIDDTFLLRHPQQRTYTIVAPGGLMVDLPPLAAMESEERTPPWRHVPRRVPLHVDGIVPALARAMQQALRQAKSVQVDGLLESLGIQNAFAHPELAAQARLRLNPALEAGWQDDRFAADCDCTLTVSEAIVQGVRNAEAGITPQHDLEAILQQANALAERGDYESLSDAIYLLSTQAIYFPPAAQERITRTRTRIQEDLFDLGPSVSDELDALFAGKIVDADAYSADLDD